MNVSEASHSHMNMISINNSYPIHLSLEELLELLNNLISDLLCASVSAHVLGAQTAVQGISDSSLDNLGLLGEVERVSEHHGHRQDGTDGVNDALARDIRGGTYTVALALTIRNTAQTGTGQETNASRDDTGFVTDDISKEVARHDNTVKTGGVLDQNHSSAVNKLVLDLEVRELLLKSLVHDLSPQTAGGQHVGLVERPHFLVTTASCEETSQTSDTLNLLSGVRLSVPGRAGAVILLALAKVDSASEFSHNDDIGTAADLGLEGRGVDEGVRGEEARSQVAVCAHLLAELQKTLLGTDSTGAPFGASNGTEEDSVGSLGGSEGLVGQRGAVGVD
ncbi:hypothetical protein HG531_011437 [Fusarium graminearum]|nr:hypothetical protein HG531_011437 [Fusarium graminearum]